MSPAKYEGGLPANPHQQMTRLDANGESYWLEDVSLIDGFALDRADVVAHGEDWLTLRQYITDGSTGPRDMVWTIRTAHVVRFRVVEG